MSSFLRGPLAAVLLTGLALPALAEGDAAKGEQVFKKCLACHSIEAGAKHKTGPNLHDIMGRNAGSVDGFKFSPAAIKAGEGGWVWTPEVMDTYLTDPKKAMPGNKMAFAGLKKADERADVIAYLQANSAAPAEGEAAAPPATN